MAARGCGSASQSPEAPWRTHPARCTASPRRAATNACIPVLSELPCAQRLLATSCA
jgi:hypothetical protein